MRELLKQSRRQIYRSAGAAALRHKRLIKPSGPRSAPRPSSEKFSSPNTGASPRMWRRSIRTRSPSRVASPLPADKPPPSRDETGLAPVHGTAATSIRSSPMSSANNYSASLRSREGPSTRRPAFLCGPRHQSSSRDLSAPTFSFGHGLLGAHAIHDTDLIRVLPAQPKHAAYRPPAQRSHEWRERGHVNIRSAGVEEELFVVAAVGRLSGLSERVVRASEEGGLEHEFFLQQVETTTQPHRDGVSLRADIVEQRRPAVAAAKSAGLRLAAMPTDVQGGTPPLTTP